ncbi:hypothetical protein CCAX7_56050 [Capsulimonas corticalis]|uniref:Uncharacterized protein n=1 Tax=Capsulimonas corticalis TaxID=2219043 RepID=A0A402D0T2_9BACT|nr:hypothetical protein [Capsulimonas corticalis]BDI33554.1 hypothetical protein CCAX7_56050 [Capsulimonas corticalis]
MVTRKFEIECKDGVMTISTVKSGLTARRMQIPWMIANIAQIVFCSMYFLELALRQSHPTLREFVCAPSAFCLLFYSYENYFGAKTCVLDTINDTVWIGSWSTSLSSVTGVRIGKILWDEEFPTGNTLYLTRKNAPALKLYTVLTFGRPNDTIRALASQIEEFLVSHKAAASPAASMVGASR